jgi:hypothetical protein
MPKTVKPASSTRLIRKTTTKEVAGANSNPKPKSASHLYTDDNPSTTLHGTGFKDSATAINTISLVSRRSLTYQFQTINTMYHRAIHHPHKTPAMGAAIVIFKEWIDVTYPATKANLRGDGGFKPLLSKQVVKRFLPRIESQLSREDKRFADIYLSLTKNKRVGNVLLDDKDPGGKDWEVERYEALSQYVPIAKEDKSGWEYEELWTEKKEPTIEHLKLIAWAWSPVPGRTLLNH